MRRTSTRTTTRAFVHASMRRYARTNARTRKVGAAAEPSIIVDFASAAIFLAALGGSRACTHTHTHARGRERAAIERNRGTALIVPASRRGYTLQRKHISTTAATLLLLLLPFATHHSASPSHLIRGCRRYALAYTHV